ncbi:MULTISPECIES: methyltransferase domain-containing protein [Empedobacter]|uniref:Thiopurine S-methyltransferase n=1 Tax=Empedobacter falsenii TaxID=343874 RepID=A0A376GFQ3_9FLAO|nr:MULTISPECIES: methyltransferase domain-containing protein [Empedobacter]MBW1619304.1 methyltransferase domain-containing protein [Empedobacter falsenii]MDH1603032.1 TPMT family class I SAM-dependent methyltransferase [Empedobacter sp. GD03739]STD59224.1 thiopurine S-methyltransferase [Empedobacter falsenii]
MELNENFWNDKYITNQTGWDLKAPSTPLKEYIDQLEDKNIRILIPGCGNAYEAEYLLEQGFTNITLIDISEIVVEKIKEKFKHNPNIKVLHQDFFELDGEFDLILEQTFFCALDPKLRQSYSIKMNELLAENGKLVGVLFNREFGNNTPPFGGDKTEYQTYFNDYFDFKVMENCYNSIPPRAGNELFINLKKMTK